MSSYPAGVDRINAGTCPKGALSPFACMLCPTGHVLECHYPKSCEQAGCDHLARGY